jgi:16S rRNA (adenine1518-N6/adenine1519-N6)-dimethyltransferase
MGLQSKINPKRSLGQNFLINESVIEKIVNVVLESNPKHITEIGPGKGAFTKAFYETTTELTLVEKDFHLAQLLQNYYKNAELHNVDFLDFKLTKPETTYFGSLPFNIAGDIIHKIISSYTFNNPAFFIIQKEVAEKYLNRDRNTLGLIREIYADFKILFDIKPGNFRPRPNVTSSFVKFVPHSKYTDIDKQGLQSIIENSFRLPRKTLKNNLKPYNYQIPQEYISKRPAELDISDYVSILERS